MGVACVWVKCNPITVHSANKCIVLEGILTVMHNVMILVLFTIIVAVHILFLGSLQLNHLMLLKCVFLLMSCCCCHSFDLPNKSWLLLTQPNGLLGALQVHVDLLAEKLSSGQQAKQLQSAGGPGDMLTHARMCSLVLARVAGCRDNQENITQGGDRLVKSVLVLVQVLLGLVSRAVRWSVSVATAFSMAVKVVALNGECSCGYQLSGALCDLPSWGSGPSQNMAEELHAVSQSAHSQTVHDFFPPSPLPFPLPSSL